MAEIKSTLELIMEKTKNLTLTEEEKKALQRKELEGRVKGWIQKYDDGLIDINQLKSDTETYKSQSQELRCALEEEVLKHIQPDGDNERMLHLLEKVLDIDTRPIIDLVGLFQKNMNTAMVSRKKSLKQNLKQKKIFGSSVVPNLNREREWQEHMDKLRLDFRNKITTLKGN